MTIDYYRLKDIANISQARCKCVVALLRAYFFLMKKIMFNDKYGLTQAVLEGRKTQTRRIAHISRYEFDVVNYEYPSAPLGLRRAILDISKYKINEIIAIAQSYRELGYTKLDIDNECITKGGLDNKMFVRGELMPNKIRITNVLIECLQDISDEDCLKEGIEFDGKARQFYCGFNKSTNSKIWLGSTPREAYSTLIDKLSGKGTWHSNPFVFVYDFELVK